MIFSGQTPNLNIKELEEEYGSKVIGFSFVDTTIRNTLLHEEAHSIKDTVKENFTYSQYVTVFLEDGRKLPEDSIYENSLLKNK